jgi:hypothetical protein
MTFRLCVLGAALLAASPALSSESEVEAPDALGGFVQTGETVNCVSMRSTSIEPIDENRLLFKVGTRYFLNETSGSCERAGALNSRIEVNLFGPRACQGDILRVVDNYSGIFEGACSLGEFRGLKKKPKDAPAEKTR